jgi:hypothetical protein
MEPTKNTGRLAGILYLLMAIPAPFSLIYVPAVVIVKGNAAATAHNLVAHETLFRLGIVADIASSVVFMLTLMVLYRLLNGVDRMQGVLMVLFGVISMPISLCLIASELVALNIARGATYLAAFDRNQLDALVMTLINLHSRGIAVEEMFWGLWLFPFGILVIRSRFLPRVLGYWLLVNGAAYVVLSLLALLAPGAAPHAFEYAQPALFGEMGIALWLAFRGASPAGLPQVLPVPA